MSSLDGGAVAKISGELILICYVQIKCNQTELNGRDEQIGSSEDKRGSARGDHVDAASSLVALHAILPLAAST